MIISPTCLKKQPCGMPVIIAAATSFPFITPLYFQHLHCFLTLKNCLPQILAKMSVISERSPKHCAEKQSTHLHNFKKKYFYYLSSFIASLLFFILLIWLILHPKTPKFSLQQAQLNLLNITSSSQVNTSIQITLQSDNPNQKVGIYYDEFMVYASYNNQKITPEAYIPPFYQGHEETNLMSAVLVGVQQPVSSIFPFEVERDWNSGELSLSFKVVGRLRWKVGSWVSGKYRFVVNCVSVMEYGDASSLPLSSRQGSQCFTKL